MKITLAFEPDDTFSNRINEVITNLAGKKIVLDVEVNHHIIAGIKIEYMGKFSDYSFETKTDEFLKKNLKNFFSGEGPSENAGESAVLTSNNVKEQLAQ